MIQIVGPCAAETEEQLRLCAQTIPHGSILRAGIWKPRTKWKKPFNRASTICG